MRSPGLGRLRRCGAGPGAAPHGRAVVPEAAPRWEGPASRPQGGMFWGNCGAESVGARRARGQCGCGGPQGSLGAAGPRWGPRRSGAPWRGGGGRKRAVGANPEEGRWSPVWRATSRPAELRPLARRERGGQEALALTSRGPAGDGGSGHSTPHRPPPAPADSGVRRHCARGGASQLRGRGSGREPGCCTCGTLGGTLVVGLTARKSPRRRQYGEAGFRGRGGGGSSADWCDPPAGKVGRRRLSSVGRGTLD